MILRPDTYQPGLNVDTEPFEAKDCYSGLYFSDLKHIAKRLEYGDLVAHVTVPPDARWSQEDTGNFKADRIILSDIQPWKDWDLWNDATFVKHAVQQDGLTLRYAKHRTPEICLAAVQQDGLALEYVKRQTPEICLAAVQQDGLALQYVKRQTPEICLAAVQQDGLAIQHVKHQTHDICVTAGQENVQSLKYAKHRTHEINLAVWLYHRRDCCGDSEDSCGDYR